MIDGNCHCGKVTWKFNRTPKYANACNCTACRRYGALWSYGSEGKTISTAGPTARYAPTAVYLAFHFCPDCGCICYWRGIKDDSEGRRHMAVNLRLASPEAVADVPVRHFDGFDTFKPLDDDGRIVAHVWF